MSVAVMPRPVEGVALGATTLDVDADGCTFEIGLRVEEIGASERAGVTDGKGARETAVREGAGSEEGAVAEGMACVSGWLR